MSDQTNLRNEDFRKLLTSARSNKPAESTTIAEQPSASFRHKQPKPAKFKKPSNIHQKSKKEKEEADEDEAKLRDIMKNYRDRAAERRKQGDKPEETNKLTAAYRAVPSDARTARDQADMRKQAILESKYLGGDIEHTHLVKGLDYSLLNKVRSEITKEDNDEDDDIDNAFEEGGKVAPTSISSELAQSQSENRMVRSMHRVLFKNEIPLRNEMFAKGRMAYVVELEDEEAEIPTTLLRSLHDCPRNESAQSIQANNLIISKLGQVLSYLRTDKQKKKKEESSSSQTSNEKTTKAKGDSIYDDLDDYVPTRRNRSRSRSRERERERERERDRDRHYRDRDNRDRRDNRRDYFDKPRTSDREKEQRDREKQREERKEHEKQRKEKEEVEKEKKMEDRLEKRRKETESAGYDECYPGGMMEMDGGWDSDEETDFSKMDMGTKKNGLNRWDFDNEEEYSSYMEGREALPKAAYQYGQKLGDGRKTRKTAVVEAKKLDRELTEINKIMEKRKTATESGGDYKKPKY
ncbi:unnamed protein product [Caenorhabditis angaria]|uniref:RED-like N-terminal domain-containing protein n=1 Tax=Caenorhabditis angaria TaxID=860376 RepID=A0A9P1MZQ2_9PELO|nr:unnamed protein product [Caenorhabditis angaria]